MKSELAAVETPISKLATPFVRFAHTEASGGILLLLASTVALTAANSPWSSAWTGFWHTEVTIGFGGHLFSRPTEFWINDGLMAIFFFVVGLEIKREILVGELSSVRKATLPIAAAIGGMAVPALIYAAITAGGPGARGWGIPMATDIAFALGVLALAGRGVPTGLKVFLTALAIVDDLGAVVVIAVFYTESIAGVPLGIASVFLVALFAANVIGARRPLPYLLLGLGLWAALLASGIHATIAGILLALTIPARARIDTGKFLRHGREVLRQFEAAGPSKEDEPTNEEHHAALIALEDASEAVQTPLQRIERMLHPWVTFCIMPAFALANAGIALTGDAGGGGVGAALLGPVSLGVFFGLLAGKPLGILLACRIAVTARLAALPEGVGWLHLAGAATLAGIGFTMSLFVTSLAFNALELSYQAKLGILAASAASGVVGWLMLRMASAPPSPCAPENQI